MATSTPNARPSMSSLRPRSSGKEALSIPQVATSVFLSLLAESGCTLCRDGMVLPARDTPAFLQKLETRLKVDSSLHHQFVTGLQEFISNDSNLRRLLTPFTCSGQESSGGADSLARLLLSITTIQTQIANILLEKLPEHCVDAASFFLPSVHESIPRLILNQFRWLEYLVDGEKVTSKLMEVLSISPIALQKEIISLIPEIASDNVHEMVVCTLEQMLQGESQLIAPILDALSNLNLQESLLDQVVSLAIGSLRTADAEDLPLVVKFLLQSATATNVRRIVNQLRENLHFVAASASSKTSVYDKKLKGKALMTNCEALVLEEVRSGLRFQNVMCEAILKEIKGLDKAQHHKVIDFWLLLIIYANGGPYKKHADSILKRKAITGLFSQNLLTQSIRGRFALIQDYFQPLLSISHGLLACKEVAARQLSSHVYVLLFEEFSDAYHRQEVLGSLVTHTGSGVQYEVGSALDALIVISSNYSEELLVLSSFITGILDYLEGFQDKHLHQVYKVFGQLALATLAHGPASNASSVANELFIILRKQITNPDPTYKRMGIIGVVKLISCLGIENKSSALPNAGMTQRARLDGTFGLLQLVMEVCKTSPMARGFFHDELAIMCEATSLDPSVSEWISKQTIEFESLFLADLDSGNIPVELKSSESLEGSAWMNLDGEVSPILLNIQTLLTSDDPRSALALMFLSSSFRLMAAVERATNQGSLGNIDALLGCPLYLPKYEMFSGDIWNDLPQSLKEIACLALYYGINWIRELVNAYSTQIQGQNENLTQATREEISAKLLKRVRNLIFLEHLLDERLKSIPSLSLPVLHSQAETRSNAVKTVVNLRTAGKRGKKRKAMDSDEASIAGASQAGRISSSQVSSGGSNTQRQTKLSDCFNGKSKGCSAQICSDSQACSADPQPNSAKLEEVVNVKERSEKAGQLEEQKWKFRPLSVHSMLILGIPQDRPLPGCCPDPYAELPLCLYILCDLEHKLECLDSQNCKRLFWGATPISPKLPSGIGFMTATEFFRCVEPVFPSLKKHLDSSAKILCRGSAGTDTDTCEEHWTSEALAAGNPEGAFPFISRHETAGSILGLTLRCLSKLFANTQLVQEHNMPTLMGFLSAFSMSDSEDMFLTDLNPAPSVGSLEYALCSTYIYLDELFDAGAATSFSVTTELVMTQKALVSCAESLKEASQESSRRRSGFFHKTGFLAYLKSRLSVSAGRVLKHDWEDNGQGKSLKSRGDALQPLLQIFLQYSDSPIELLEELASNIMTQVPHHRARSGDSVQDYPTLCQGNFLVWYRVQHEELFKIFNKVIKEIVAMHKSKSYKEDDIDLELIRARQCTTVLVSLVNLTKIHCNKVAVHSAAVKFGGKFIDTFLKGMDFWQAGYRAHKESINAMVKELQKATRTIQTLCSEAKGMRKLPVTSKIPAVKRSLERYVFCVKALLHSVSQGSSFWMGNLKHKNLQGEEVGSQLPVSDEEMEEAAELSREDDDDAEQVECNGSDASE